VAICEPFALVHAGGDLRLILLGDVSAALEDAAWNGPGRAHPARPLRGRRVRDRRRGIASPDGSPEHPRAREVIRVIVGHADGTSGSTWCELRRGADGTRLSGLWETE
jgi:hypothetical protein